MLYVVLFFTLFSFFLYVLLGGADFGAGIVELFSSRENKKITRDTVYRVMGPIWEANHIWLIILIVILWVAFPAYFNVIIIYLHVPFTLILLGITMRGVAFIFRHYDAVVDKSQVLYNWMFRISSFITPVFLGMAFGALIGGSLIITNDYEAYTFSEIFMGPWLNIFTILVGLFYAMLCAFLASTLLIGESEGEVRKMYSRKSASFT
ncbi:MAG: cytochrome d ubiquinol oxidase subunit II, partial [Salegentibacter sp.]